MYKRTGGGFGEKITVVKGSAERRFTGGMKADVLVTNEKQLSGGLRLHFKRERVSEETWCRAYRWMEKPCGGESADGDECYQAAFACGGHCRTALPVYQVRRGQGNIAALFRSFSYLDQKAPEPEVCLRHDFSTAPKSSQKQKVSIHNFHKKVSHIFPIDKLVVYDPNILRKLK